MISKNKQTPQYKRVQLLFVRGVHEPGESDVGKKDWALFLSTEPTLAMSKMLEPPRLSRRQLRLGHAAISRFSLAA